MFPLSMGNLRTPAGLSFGDVIRCSVADDVRRGSQYHRQLRDVFRFASYDVEQRRFVRFMPPPVLKNWQRPSAVRIPLTRHRKSGYGPKGGSLWVFEDASKATDLLHCPNRQLLLVGSRFGKVTKPAPSTAWRVGYNWPGAIVGSCIARGVIHIAARNGFIDAVFPGEQNSNHCSVFRRGARRPRDGSRLGLVGHAFGDVFPGKLSTKNVPSAGMPGV